MRNLATATAWETGLTCDREDCGGEFALGEEYQYWYGKKLHQRCAAVSAAERRGQAGEADPLEAAEAALAAGTRIILTRAQLRALAVLAEGGGAVPVRKPDAGRQQWYGRMPGWSAARVKAGLSAAEAAGMWLDFLDAGRMPPVRASDVSVIIAAIRGVTLPSS